MGEFLTPPKLRRRRKPFTVDATSHLDFGRIGFADLQRVVDQMNRTLGRYATNLLHNDGFVVDVVTEEAGQKRLRQLISIGSNCVPMRLMYI